MICVFSYDCNNKDGDGRHLALFTNGKSDCAMKKLFKKILSRRDFFGIDDAVTVDDMFRAYFDGGLDTVSKIMEYGSVEILNPDKWVADQI